MHIRVFGEFRCYSSAQPSSRVQQLKSNGLYMSNMKQFLLKTLAMFIHFVCELVIRFDINNVF
jgi:hypothetical protein